jgi:hypothetical protein
MEFGGRIEDSFKEWLGYRQIGTSWETTQAAHRKYAIQKDIPLKQVGIDGILERGGIEEKKAEEISCSLIEYFNVLNDEQTMKAFQDGFQLAAHLLSA